MGGLHIIGGRWRLLQAHPKTGSRENLGLRGTVTPVASCLRQARSRLKAESGAAEAKGAAARCCLSPAGARPPRPAMPPPPPPPPPLPAAETIRFAGSEEQHLCGHVGRLAPLHAWTANRSLKSGEGGNCRLSAVPPPARVDGASGSHSRERRHRRAASCAAPGRSQQAFLPARCPPLGWQPSRKQTLSLGWDRDSFPLRGWAPGARIWGRRGVGGEGKEGRGK